MPKTKKPIIRLERVSKKYNEYGVEVKALDGVSLEVFPGEFVSVIGPSGCGKSTLLHCMGLLDRPSSGSVYIDEKDTSKITGKEIALFRENVMLPGLIMEKDISVVKKKACVLLKDVGIEHRADHKGIHLSGGEQQKAAIARALINDPVLVLADEPTGALDSENSTEIMKLLVKMNEKRKATFVFVSHDMDIAGYGKRTIVLKDGRVIGDVIGDSKDFERAMKKLVKRAEKQERRKIS